LVGGDSRIPRHGPSRLADHLGWGDFGPPCHSGEAAIGQVTPMEAIPMNIASASIPEFVAYQIIGGTLVDLRHADRMLGAAERQAPDPVRAAHVRAIRAAMEQLRHVTGPSPKQPKSSESVQPLGLESRTTRHPCL